MKKSLQHMVMKLNPHDISCEQATFLVSKKQHVRLKLQETISLHMHFIVCKFCKMYEEEIKLISDKIHEFMKIEKSGKKSHIKLPADKKKAISDRVNDQLNS